MKKLSSLATIVLFALSLGKAEHAGWNSVDEILMEVGSSSVNYYATTSENGGYWDSDCPPATPIQYIWVQNNFFAAKELYSMLLTAKSSGAKVRFRGTCQNSYLVVTDYVWMK